MQFIVKILILHNLPLYKIVLAEMTVIYCQHINTFIAQAKQAKYLEKTHDRTAFKHRTDPPVSCPVHQCRGRGLHDAG